MVMASAGVNVPGGGGGGGNPTVAAGSSPTAEWRLRRRRRLSPPPAAAAAAASGSGSPPRTRRRLLPPSPPASPPTSPTASPPTSSSDEEPRSYSDEEEDTEEDEDDEGSPIVRVGLALPAPRPPRASAAAQAAWPVAFGSMELAGRMREMEDTVSIHPDFFTWVDGTPMHFFAVFDGHGGTHVSALCRNQMHSILAEHLAAEGARFLHRRRQELHHRAAWDNRAEEENAWRAALRRAFARVDDLATLACACGAATVPRCRCPLSGVTSAIVGSTAVVAVLVGGRIVVANCGDSRAVLCQGPDGTPAVPLSVDHKPDRPDERARIESVGGQVIYLNGPRVRGILAMSRALGDRFLRPEVIAEPEITVTQRSDADQCIILASDGMWDAISNETACSVARQCLEDGDHPHPSAAPANAPGALGPSSHRCDVTAAILARLALGRGSPDNVSIVVVDLRNRAV